MPRLAQPPRSPTAPRGIGPGTSASTAPKGYRIAELAKLAKVSVATVKYYIREGLLPSAPRKTGRTMGWYDDAYLERLKLIRDLREQHFLPLKVIATILAERGDVPLSASEAALVARVGPAVLRRLEPVAPTAISRAQLIREHDIPAAELKLLEEMGLIGDGSGHAKTFSAGDAELLMALAAAEKAGLTRQRFPVAGIGHYVELIGELARREVRVFSHGAQGIPGVDLEALAVRAISITEPIVAAIRKKLILRALREELYGPAARATVKREPVVRRRARITTKKDKEPS